MRVCMHLCVCEFMHVYVCAVVSHCYMVCRPTKKATISFFYNNLPSLSCYTFFSIFLHSLSCHTFCICHLLLCHLEESYFLHLSLAVMSFGGDLLVQVFLGQMSCLYCLRNYELGSCNIS